MKQNIFKSAAIIVMSTLLVIGLNAQPRRGGQCYYKDRDFNQEQNFKRGPSCPALNLSEEQQEQMNALRIEHFKKMEPLRNKMGELRAQRRTLMSEENVDLKSVNKNIDEQTALMNKMQKLRTEHQLAVKGILNDEQEMQMSGNWPGAGMCGYGPARMRRGR
ncbi:MAG: Spy/CpxP family protein refolding chaperone [Bacteroidales bacterium]|nr:Spy/CpxP family protein refolding chaperone [Bacteroidales bacterium]MBN2698670.1 Spy/CpxP family protein refolding chaperone [Bacteroidales bacterium]